MLLPVLGRESRRRLEGRAVQLGRYAAVDVVVYLEQRLPDVIRE